VLVERLLVGRLLALALAHARRALVAAALALRERNDAAVQWWQIVI
jgi:hypothetical protein